MKIQDLLSRIVKEGASDGFIAADAPPCIKVDGQIYPISDTPLSEAQTLAMVESTMRSDQQDYFRDHNECNYAITSEIGRFRASAYVQRGKAGLAVGGDIQDVVHTCFDGSRGRKRNSRICDESAAPRHKVRRKCTIYERKS